MRIKLNNQTVQIDPRLTLQILLREYHVPETGLAAAINNRVIPHSSWSSTVLSEHDEITLFQAIAGG